VASRARFQTLRYELSSPCAVDQCDAFVSHSWWDSGAAKYAALALWAERFELEIISVDSALVYRGLDIGAAKPDRATLAAFPHELVDIADPAQPYSTGEFLRDVLPAMERVRRRRWIGQ
jgi:hypothetical protein